MPHTKTTSVSAADISASHSYRTGLYVRLSADDLTGGEKIKNQLDLLLKFTETQNDLAVTDIYIDNGQTGTDFNRAEWQRLMADIDCKRVNCIIVKDLSRLGRNYIETGWYLENVFPGKAVRFIAINDNYDSVNLGIHALQPLDAMIKGIVNEAYAKDISRKIFATKEQQRKNGLFYGNIPPYGYCKDPKDPHHLIINNETAPVVREIFQQKLQGSTNTAIANYLNNSNIPAPMRYQFLQGAVKAARFQNSTWQRTTIKVILQNRTYTGDLTAGKKLKNISRNINKVRNLPYDAWTIVNNTHEPVISRELFFKVQDICLKELEINQELRKRHSDIVSPEDIFAGLIYSKKTGMKMYRTRTCYPEHGMKYRYTTVSQQNTDFTKCPMVSIKEEQIDEILITFLQKQMEIILDIKAYLTQAHDHQALLHRKEELTGKIDGLSSEIEAFSLKQQQLYQDYSEGLLTRSEFLEVKGTLQANRNDLEKKLIHHQSDRDHMGTCPSSQNRFIQPLVEYYETGQLTKELLNKIIDKIYICDSHSMEIVLKYQNAIEPVLKLHESGVHI